MLSLPSSTRIIEFLLLSFHISFSGANPTFRTEYCDNSTQYAPNSTYQTNLNLLLTSLSSNATANVRFLNATAGRTPHTVYGLFNCGGDVTDDVCRVCVNNASRTILQRCSNREEVAEIYYDECMLRYSNQLFFSNVNEVAFFSFSIAGNTTDPDGFNDLLVEVMNRIVNRAAYDSSAGKFATEEANFTKTQTWYSLVQCTLDLSANDCNRCLRSARLVCSTNSPSIMVVM